MPKLHLVAITPDNRGLVLSEGTDPNRGDLVLDIDDRLLEAIDRAQRQRARDEGQKLSSAALPSRKEPSDGEEGGRLSPRQIQDRLRAGESVAAIANSSGTDEAWVERFAAPVLSELEMIVTRARDLTFTKPRVGPSQQALGEAVAANLVERGVDISAEEIEEGWAACQRADGTWLVVFSFPQKGRRQRAEWSVDLGSGELTARNKLATELGYRDSGRRPTRPASIPPKAAPPAKAAPPGQDAPSATADEAASAPGRSAPEPPTPTSGADGGLQTLPGTGPEIDDVLDSIAVAPPVPAAAEPPAAPPADAAPGATRPAETDPTIEISLPAVPDPGDPPRPPSRTARPDPNAPPADSTGTPP